MELGSTIQRLRIEVGRWARLAVVALVTAGVAVSLQLPAHAAEVRLLEAYRFDEQHSGSIDVDSGLGSNLRNDAEIVCNIALDGPITDGDLKRLQSATAELARSRPGATPRVCLNSGGGAYHQGLAISRWLMSENIGTAVRAGAECHSACALIFMGGSFPWKGHINRFLEVGGIVGFHAPYVSGLKEKPYSNADMQVAFDEGVRAISALMSLGVGSDLKRFPPELLDELLKKGPREVFEIDTVGKAIRFRVSLFGIAAPPAVSEATLCNACVNMKYGANEAYGRRAETDLCATPGDIARKRTDKGMRLTFDVAPRGGTCIMDIAMDRSTVHGWMYQRDDGDKWQDGLELAYWFLYPPNTRLADLAPRALPRREAAPPPPRREEQRPPPPQRRSPDIERLVVNFVTADYLGSGLLNHESRAEHYAARIDYYDKGQVSRDAVMADKRAYYTRWQRRRYEVVPGSIASRVTADGTREVTFRYVFEVSDTKRTVSGTGTTTLGLVTSEGRFLVMRETGRVLSRR